MRAAAGLIALNTLLVAVGLGVLGAAGLLRLRLRTLAAAAPTALLAGTAVVGTVGTVFLVSGTTLELPVFTAATVALVVVLGAVTVMRHRRGTLMPDRAGEDAEDRGDRWAFWIVVGVVVVFVLVQAYASRNVRAGWDAEHNWTLKAVALTTGGLEGDLFTGRVPFAAAHLDYPILQPVLGALIFRFAGKAENGLILFELWLLCGAFVLALPHLTGQRPRAWLTMIPPTIAIAALTSWGILRGEADVTVAIFLAAGAFALMLWIEGGHPGLAVVGAVMLGGAVNTKNEGLAFSAAILLAAAIVLVATAPRRRLLPLAGVVVAVAAFLVPWYLWVKANGPFARDVTPLSTSLDARFLSDRLNRLEYALKAVVERFASSGAHAYILPAFVAVAGAILITGPRRRVAAFYSVAIAIALMGLLWVYWTTSQPDWDAHIARTSARTICGPLFLAAVGLAHLIPPALSGTFGRPPAAPPPRPAEP